MPALEPDDFDPNFDMLEAARWLLRAADYAFGILRDHPEKESFCSELRLGAISMARLHGQIDGVLATLKHGAQHNAENRFRIDRLKFKYTDSRANLIDAICNLYLKAVVMERDVNSGPGRPRKRLPDYKALDSMTDSESIWRFVQYAMEFSIAVKLAENKKTSGKYSGLKKLLDEAVESGRMDDTGDTAQRIKRLARQLHEDSALNLSPGLREARATAQQFIYSGE